MINEDVFVLNFFVLKKKSLKKKSGDFNTIL